MIDELAARRFRRAHHHGVPTTGMAVGPVHLQRLHHYLCNAALHQRARRRGNRIVVISLATGEPLF